VGSTSGTRETETSSCTPVVAARGAYYGWPAWAGGGRRGPGPALGIRHRPQHRHFGQPRSLPLPKWHPHSLQLAASSSAHGRNRVAPPTSPDGHHEADLHGIGRKHANDARPSSTPPVDQTPIPSQESDRTGGRSEKYPARPGPACRRGFIDQTRCLTQSVKTVVDGRFSSARSAPFGRLSITEETQSPRQHREVLRASP
jgi:hypothetical protein